MKNKYWLIIISIIIVIFGIREFINRKNNDKLISEIVNYKNTVEVEKLKNGALIYSNKTLKLESQKQIKEMASNLNDTVKQMLKKFKRVESVTEIVSNTIITRDTIKLENNIPCITSPIKIIKKTPNYSFKGTLDSSKFTIDTISIPNVISIIIGRKKTGFLKYEDMISINNSNPLVETSNISSYTYKPKKRFLQKTWVHIAGGVVIAVIAKSVIQKYTNK